MVSIKQLSLITVILVFLLSIMLFTIDFTRHIGKQWGNEMNFYETTYINKKTGKKTVIPATRI